MNQTIDYYNNHARDFCDSTLHADMSDCRDRFTSYLPARAHILDAGCGSGRDSKAFKEEGFHVTAMDASWKLCEKAEKLLQQHVQCLTFEELSFADEFDGIWACASLLHVARTDMDDVLARLRKALKENGILYASFKYGRGERTAGGRFFNDYDEASLRETLERQKYGICELFLTEDVRRNRAGEQWVNVIAKKHAE